MKLTVEEVLNCLKGLRKGLSRQYIDSVPDSELFSEVADYYGHQFEELEAKELGGEKNQPQSPIFGLLLISELQCQVFNGGFNQFMFNRGEYASATLVALQQLCGQKHAEPLKSILRTFALKQEIHKDAQKAGTVSQLLQNFSDTYDFIDFDDEDHQWYELEEERDQVIADYIRSHITEFIDVGQAEPVDLPSPLDTYFDDLLVFRLEQKAWKSTKWNDSDIAGSRKRKIISLVKAFKKLVKEENYVAASCLMQRIIRQVSLWDMDVAEILDALRQYIPVLIKLSRPRQAAALDDILKSR